MVYVKNCNFKTLNLCDVFKLLIIIIIMIITNNTKVLTPTPPPLMVYVKIAILKHWITLCWPPLPFQTIKTLISTVWPSNMTKIKYVQFKISKTSQIKNVFSSGPGSSPRNVIVRPLSSSTMVSLSRIFLSYYLIILSYHHRPRW